ncbi:MAG: glycine cleavage system protein GcvH [Acidobacteriota bacterium]
MLRYTKEHAWVDADSATATLGITDYAQQQLGDIVYVDLPNPGTALEQGKALGTVESVKSVSEIVAPVSGEVIETNTTLADTPEKLNRSPESDAWMVKVKLTNPTEVDALLDAAAYAAFTKSEA